MSAFGYILYRCYRCGKPMRSDNQGERTLVTVERSDDSHTRTERYTLCAEDTAELIDWLNGPRNAELQQGDDIPIGDNGQ